MLWPLQYPKKNVSSARDRFFNRLECSQKNSPLPPTNASCPLTKTVVRCAEILFFRISPDIEAPANSGKKAAPNAIVSSGLSNGKRVSNRIVSYVP